jgi:hypothetical protein
MSSWFIVVAALFVLATIAYFLFESFREPLLEMLADSLHWTVPSTFAACAVFFVCCAVVTTSKANVGSGPREPTSIEDVARDPAPGPSGQPIGQLTEVSAPTTEPERQAGLRVVVIEAVMPGSDTPSRALAGRVEIELEKALRTAGIRLLADRSLRAELIAELQRYQNSRALYDPATLKQVQLGHFHGATHAAFWSVTNLGTAATLECRLVRLRTSQVIGTHAMRVDSEESLGKSVQEAAASLLADIAEVSITSPVRNDLCGRTIAIRGRVQYLPQNWTLWITMLPDGLSNHYPQKAATMQRDGSFLASEVYLGENAILQPQRFSVYTVMADEEYSNRIRMYLANPNTVGLDIQNWPPQHSRVIKEVPVTRSPGIQGGCKGV